MTTITSAPDDMPHPHAGACVCFILPKDISHERAAQILDGGGKIRSGGFTLTKDPVTTIELGPRETTRLSDDFEDISRRGEEATRQFKEDIDVMLVSNEKVTRQDDEGEWVPAVKTERYSKKNVQLTPEEVQIVRDALATIKKLASE